jgi:hypothetical protein
MSDLNRLPRGSRATPSNAGGEQGAPRWPGSSRKLDSTTGDLHEVGKAVAFSSRCSFPNSPRESGGEGLRARRAGSGRSAHWQGVLAFSLQLRNYCAAKHYYSFWTKTDFFIYLNENKSKM